MKPVAISTRMPLASLGTGNATTGDVLKRLLAPISGKAGMLIFYENCPGAINAEKMEVLSRIKKTLGIVFPLEELYEDHILSHRTDVESGNLDDYHRRFPSAKWQWKLDEARKTTQDRVREVLFPEDIVSYRG